MNEFGLLTSSFSPQRLKKYLDYHKGNEEKAVIHYKENLRLAQSAYISISVFEVSLRNAISRSLSRMSGDKSWVDVIDNNPDLKDFQVSIDHATSQIKHRHETVSINKLIAELNFGFWVMLLNSKYENILWKYIRLAFPYMPKQERKRKNISTPCNSIRNLRNRIFHNEAICWNLDYVTSLHNEIKTVLRCNSSLNF